MSSKNCANITMCNYCNEGLVALYFCNNCPKHYQDLCEKCHKEVHITTRNINKKKHSYHKIC